MAELNMKLNMKFLNVFWFMACWNFSSIAAALYETVSQDRARRSEAEIGL